jgi:hypothetical protein
MRLLRNFCGLNTAEFSVGLVAASTMSSGWLVVGRHSCVGYAVLVSAVLLVSIAVVIYSRRA